MIDHTLDVLRAARARLATPHSWTKERLAANEHGVTVSWDGPDARCFCSDGALLRASESIVAKPWAYMPGYDTATRLLDRAAAEVLPVHGRNFIAANDGDGTTHRDVLRMFDRAIGMRRAELAGVAA